MKSQEDLQEIFDYVPFMVCVLNANREILYYNRSFAEFVDKPEDQMAGQRACGIFDCINSLEDPRGCGFGNKCESCNVKQALQNSLDSGTSYRDIRYETTRVRNGQHEPVVMMASTARILLGEQYVLLMCLYDLTEQERTRAALFESERRFRSMVDSAPVLVWISGPDKLCEYFNAGWLEFTGRSLQQETGNGWLDGVHPDDKTRCLAVYNRAFEERHRFEMEYRLRRHDGQYRWIIDLGVPRFALNGSFLGYIGSCFDITERREAADAMRRAEARANAANAAKSEFLSNMSHEIRTPLNGIMGMTELLNGTNPTLEQQEYLEMLQSSARILLAIISDILDLSRIEAGKIELEKSGFSLRETVELVRSTCFPIATMKKLDISIEILPTVPDRIMGDALRFKQILLNLLGNAVKFTEKGSVSLAIRADEELDEHFIMHGSVSDSGIGMMPDILESIFEPFVQGDLSMTKKYGGTGLGLSITRRLVELMGGRIWAESTPGTGSSFHFRLPFEVSSPDGKLPDAPARQPLPICQGPDLSILLVEDNEMNLKFSSTVLKQMGHRVDPAYNGSEAVEKFKTGQYDLILMDLRMPVMDGFDALRLIQTLEGSKHTPVIAVTAHTLRGDREKILGAGFDGFLAKPFRISELCAAIKQVLEKAGNVPGLNA